MSYHDIVAITTLTCLHNKTTMSQACLTVSKDLLPKQGATSTNSNKAEFCRIYK